MISLALHKRELTLLSPSCLVAGARPMAIAATFGGLLALGWVGAKSAWKKYSDGN